MNDSDWFGVGEDPLRPDQEVFLAELRRRLGDRLRPRVAMTDPLLLLLDVDAPDVALVSVGLRLDRSGLIGDRVGIDDWTFPPTPTPEGFRAAGGPAELARQGADFLQWFARRPIVRHEWVHAGRVYAHCYLFDDTGERLAQMYRADWAPPGQQARLAAAGHVREQGWVQTEGLDRPDRVVRL